MKEDAKRVGKSREEFHQNVFVKIALLGDSVYWIALGYTISVIFPHKGPLQEQCFFVHEPQVHLQ